MLLIACGKNLGRLQYFSYFSLYSEANKELYNLVTDSCTHFSFIQIPIILNTSDIT